VSSLHALPSGTSAAPASPAAATRLSRAPGAAVSPSAPTRDKVSGRYLSLYSSTAFSAHTRRCSSSGTPRNISSTTRRVSGQSQPWWG